MSLTLTLCVFFLGQQFITWSTKAVCGSYFVTMYMECHMQVHPSRNNVPTVKPPSNYTSLPSMVATFLAIHLMAVLQLSGYSVFHSGDTPIQLSLL